MKTLIIIAVILLILYLLLKSGNNKFWQLANKNPLEAYNFFINNDCWYVIHPNEDKEKPKIGDWSGPFFFIVPSIGRIKLYGKVGQFEEKQREFIKLFNN